MTKIYCALDTADMEEAKALARAIAPVTGGLKCGLEFFSAFGPDGVREVMEAAGPRASLFLDLKFHDIPNTVAGAVRAVSDALKPDYLNVHASGGLPMMRAARDACAPETKLLAVTVLTSLSEETLQDVGQRGPMTEQVLRLARLAQAAGLAGVVCSAHEIELLRAECGPDFVLMVPGIRPGRKQVSGEDQRRVMTPAQAIAAGATHMVVGRPITQAPDPGQAAAEILAELEAS